MSRGVQRCVQEHRRFLPDAWRLVFPAHCFRQRWSHPLCWWLQLVCSWLCPCCSCQLRWRGFHQRFWRVREQIWFLGIWIWIRFRRGPIVWRCLPRCCQRRCRDGWGRARWGFSSGRFLQLSARPWVCLVWFELIIIVKLKAVNI